MMEMDKGQVCEHRDHLGVWIPIITIIFAIVFTLGSEGVISAQVVNGIWPLLVGLAGIVKLSQYKCRCEPGCSCGCK